MEARALPGAMNVEDFDRVLKAAIESDATKAQLRTCGNKNGDNVPVCASIEDHAVRRDLPFTVIHDAIRGPELRYTKTVREP